MLENYENIRSIISVNTNILLRRFRLKFLRIMYSISCCKERLNFENTLYNIISGGIFFRLYESLLHSNLSSGIIRN
jgi:hypothetical protein